MQGTTLPLRDIHQALAPAWWPPAPGWWVVAAFVLAVVVTYVVWRQRKRSRQRRIADLFDNAVDAVDAGPVQIAAMSELLRRAARRRDPQADRIQGDAWLAFLDADDERHPFTEGGGRLLLEGGFRRDADPRQVAELRVVARERFVRWMAK